MKKEMRQLLRHNIEGLKTSDRTLKSLYYYIFYYKNNIMCEGHDGLRTYTYTYGQMDEKIRRVAAGLYEKLGAQHQYIALEMDNSPQWIAGFWAILMSGNKPYLVNLRYPDGLTEGILKTLGIRYTLCMGESRLSVQALDIAQLESDGPAVPEDVFADEIAFSSSATSMNEVICFYTGAEVCEQMLACQDIFRWAPRVAKHHKGRLKLLAFLPFYHVFGLVAVFMWFSFFGRTLVFLRDYNPDTILKTCRRHQVTHIFAVPMLWHTIEKKVWANAREQGQEEKLRKTLRFTTGLQNVFPGFGAWVAQRLLGSVTEKLFGKTVYFCISGGSSLRPSALELMNGLGYSLHNGYGMSEVGIPCVETRHTPKACNRGSIGKPVSSVRFRLDEEGVLYIKSPFLCTHKLVNGELQQTPEWFCTGDIMTCRDGYYYIQGRKGDVVIGENGENINPDTVEATFTLEGIKQLCVLGLPDAQGQSLSLVVQVSPYVTEQTVEAIKSQAYACNDRLPKAMAVKNFYFTFEELSPPTAIKVSRTQLTAKIKNGQVNLTPFAQLQLRGNEGEDTPLLRKIRAIIAKELDCQESAIGANSHIFYDLGASSLQYFAIVSAVSAEFGVTEYNTGEIYCYTPKEICAYLEKKL